MSGFAGFGNTGNAAAGTAFSFGANKTTTSGFTLGTTASPAPAPGNLFGSTPSFGATGTGLTFGTPTSQPATGGLFGSPAPQTSGLTFGTPVSSSAPATAPTGLGFGGTGLSFGTPGAGQAGSTGISFGTPTTQTGLTFGAPAASAGGTGLTFGSTPTTAATTQPGFNFGNIGTAAPSTGLAFGTPTTSAPSTGLTFGTPNVTTTQTGLTFGTAVTSTGTSGSLSFGTVTTTSAAPLGFQGLSTTTAAKPLGGLSFGTTTTTAAAPATGFSLSAATSTAQTPGFTLGGTSTAGGLFGLGLSKPLLGTSTVTTTTAISAPTTTASIGLGGVDTSQTKPGLTGTSPGRPDAKAVKENQIPHEILQTIESFKLFVKNQKGFSSDIARGSVKPLHKIQEDTESLKQMLAGLTSGFQRNGALADKLKADTAKCLHHAEMAQRTHETPPGLQYDNVAPIEYFTELVAGFERDMQVFRQEIENTEKHILSLSQPLALTPQELALAMRRLHDSFVALAGRLQTVHNSVEVQKEQYLNLRKYFLKDSTNVFEEQAKKLNAGGIKPITNVKIAPGPTPFSVLGSQHGFGLLPSNTTDQKPSFPSGNPLGWSTGQQQQQQNQLSSSIGGNFFSSGTFAGGLSSLPTAQSSDTSIFQLQKPPPGNKRGKR
ncbi:hypothetical protein C0J52_12891 [Blattella germanica]|nr:hypothetical protein C0J52_12891 [Blattella germanica]